MNIINGGAHANNGLRIQEFMIRPDRAKSFSEAMRICFVVIKNLSKLIKDKGLSTSVGDEGGFAPMISGNNQALDLIVLAIKKAGFRLEEQMGESGSPLIRDMIKEQLDSAGIKLSSDEHVIVEINPDDEYVIDGKHKALVLR